MILTIEANSAKELKQKIQDLADIFGIDMALMPTPVLTGGAEENKPADVVGAGTEGKPAKQTRTRKPTQSVDVAATSTEETAAADTATSPTTEKVQQESSNNDVVAYTKQDVADWTQKVSTAKDITFARSVMAKFIAESGEPCIRISDIKVSEYESYINTCKSAIASLEKSA